MTSFSPLFGTGLARSGGGLYSNCLSSNQDIMLACCPNIQLFKYFRNSIFQHNSGLDILREIPAEAPLQDFYGSDIRVKALDVLMNASLDISFDMDQWDNFLNTSINRGTLESGDLIKYYGINQQQKYSQGSAKNQTLTINLIFMC